jgi:serine/threonine protein kinase/Tfp pilus assembly protein PilF
MSAPKGGETIFAEALRLPPNDRAAYVAQATVGNSELRQEVESLLQNYAAGEFLEQAAAPELRPTLISTAPFTEVPGDTIGRYKLLQQIGEGGCGIVYMAEQVEPVRRRVALKIIKLGMDTKSVVARFEAERQALALMDHPNIAKVFDAGATETGRPYFVMELVRGRKITEYCDEKKLSTRARLDLFTQVCKAIQHAHQKGIIHRDIKPSNILVSVDDGLPVPKVIDFGIAKATSGQQLTNRTLFTAFEQFIGTPAYMSPEQAMLTNVDVDTRSDIYALGVLLYELLTGKTPFDAQKLLAIGLDEMRRTIREQEPERPSTRLSTLPDQELSTTAQHRGLDAPKLVSELRGDLDWIVMKALEKDRGRRYETANGLSADINRHLNNEPVIARPPSNGYRFQKMLRRNKMAFAAGTAVVASLMIGLTLSTVLFFRERQAREQANKQRANAEKQQAKASEEAAMAKAVNDFLIHDLLRQAASEAQAEANFRPDPNLTVRQALERAADRIGDRFRNQPLQEAAVRLAIGHSLIAVGEPSRAAAHLEKTVELARAKLGASHVNTRTAMNYLGVAYSDSGEVNKALAIFEERLQLQTATAGADDKETLGARMNLAAIYERTGRIEKALMLYKETLQLMKANLGPADPYTLNVMQNLANCYRATGKLDQALPLSEETLKLRQAALEANHPSILQSMRNLASVYRDMDQLDLALPLLEKTLNSMEATLSPEHPETVAVMMDLALGFRESGNVERSLPLAKKALELQQAKRGTDDPNTVIMMNHLASLYREVGKIEEALPLLDETLKVIKLKSGRNDRKTLGAMNNLALGYRDAGKLDLAVPVLEETFKLMTDNLPDSDSFTLNAMGNLALFYAEAGNLDQAQTLGVETVKRRKAALGANHPATLGAIKNLAEAYRRAGKLDEVEKLLRSSLDEVQNLAPGDLSESAPLVFPLVETLLSQNKYEEAEKVLSELLRDPVQMKPENALFLLSRADLYARRARFAEAATDLTRAIEINFDQHEAWHFLAPILVQQGRLDAYREHCRKGVERFRSTTDPAIAERIAKDCLILPTSGVDLEVVGKMADTAAAVTNHTYTPWFQLVKGLSEYRRGCFASSVEWMNKMLSGEEKGLVRDAQAFMVLAMAHQQLKQTEKARAMFAKGAEIERTRLSEVEREKIDEGWLDRIIARAFMREADGLLNATQELNLKQSE